jgi:uncharacterized surface protein with fasciclin (FAS1) repeats
MKLHFMSLALLAIATDAAPGGFKKDGESASLHRSLELDDSEAAVAAEDMCKSLETFDNMGRGENNDNIVAGLSWIPLCDDFEPLNDSLCPTENAVAAICSAEKPYENPAVRKNWCHPLFELIEDSDRYDSCMTFCTNYVSAARGGCCDFRCAGTIEPPTQPTIADFIRFDPELSIVVEVVERVTRNPLMIRTETSKGKGKSSKGNGKSTKKMMKKNKFEAATNSPTSSAPSPCKGRFGCGRKLNVRRVNLLQLLDSPGDFTFFAPTNSAFQNIPRDLLALLLLSNDHLLHLEDLLLYHGMNGERRAVNFVDKEVIPSFNSQEVLVGLKPLRINNISVISANYLASNGVTHVIGGVLAPEWVFHTLLDFARTTMDLSLFLELVVLVDRDDRLNRFGDAYTLLGPTNNAIRAVGRATLAEWRAPANQDDLRRIVEYHIISGVSAVLVEGDSLETTEFDTKTRAYLQIEVSVNGDKVMFNQATAQSDGRLANNGILYTINAVLNPDSVDGF